MASSILPSVGTASATYHPSEQSSMQAPGAERVPKGTMTCLPPLPRSWRGCSACGGLTLRLPLTTRCPGSLHPGSRSLAPSYSSLGQHTLASFFPGPGSWGPDTDRLAWFQTRTPPQLPLSTHLPFSETKSHFGVSESSALSSIPENQEQDPPCRQPER